MDRLFLDANVLFSAAYSPNSVLLRFWRLTNATLCSSHYAVEEAKSNLATQVQRERLQSLTAKLELIDVDYSDRAPAGHIPLPEKDRPILLAAIAAGASHLITGDIRHFGPFFGKSIGGILVLPPSQYLKRTSSHLRNAPLA